MTDTLSKDAARNKAVEQASRRDSIRSNLEVGSISMAIQEARTLLLEEPSLLNIRFVRQLVEGMPREFSVLQLYRVALLSSSSIEFIHDSLIALGFINSLRIEIYQPGFGLIRQEILNSSSGLYAFSPDVTILAIEGEDWFPEIYNEFMDAGSDSSGLGSVVDKFRIEIAGLMGAWRNQSTSPLLVHSFALPRVRRAGVADIRMPDGQAKLVADLNRALNEAVSKLIDVHVVDYAALVNYFGVHNWYDSRMRLYAKAPIANGMLVNLSQEYLKYFRALGGWVKKCLVVDLDNTLWGGVVGEDGVDGIELGANYPGSAYVEFQRVILDLYRRGVILAVASKNNPADVDAVFLDHRFMMIRKEHFAAMEIHWSPKSDSLKRIAKRLNIGLDHMVFVDDNPAECEQIRRELPVVTVINLPRRPELYVDALCVEGLFDVIGLSNEDRHRGELYQQREKAETIRSASGNIENYYRDLDMFLSIARVDQASRARAAQLTQKTNQFNLTTIRYSEAELAERMADPNWLAISVGVRDRFGDSGIVGIMLAKIVEDSLNIDTFLLSCRVIGRTVETAMLAFLCEAAHELGLRKICGLVVPTEKNLPARDLYKKHGFSMQSEDLSGVTRWVLDMESKLVQRPAWFG